MGVSRLYKTVYNTRHSIQHSSHFVLVKGKLLGENSDWGNIQSAKPRAQRSAIYAHAQLIQGNSQTGGTLRP